MYVATQNVTLLICFMERSRDQPLVLISYNHTCTKIPIRCGDVSLLFSHN